MSIFNALLRPVSQVEMERKLSERVISPSAVNEEKGAAQDVVKTSDIDLENVTVDVPGCNILNYFKTRDIALDTSKSNNSFAPVEELAMLLAINYEYCKEFYKYIRSRYTKKKEDFCYNTYPLTNEEREATNKVARELGRFGIISNLVIHDNSKEIIGTLSSAPRVINFLNGDFLEFYARCVIQQVVEQIAKDKKCTFEIYSNVYIKKGTEKHELDVVFRIGTKVFWGEIKSGKFTDFDYYRRLGVLMGVNPDKHILLSAEKTDKEALTISWFYQFYVANIQTFKERLIEMIENTFVEVK